MFAGVPMLDMCTFMQPDTKHASRKHGGARLRWLWKTLLGCMLMIMTPGGASDRATFCIRLQAARANK